MFYKTNIKNLLSVHICNIKAQTLFVDIFTQYFNHRRLYITKKLHSNIERLFQKISFQFLFELNFYYVRLGFFLFGRILQNRQQKRVSKLIAKAIQKNGIVCVLVKKSGALNQSIILDNHIATNWNLSDHHLILWNC